jgi:hypothetical protein
MGEEAVRLFSHTVPEAHEKFIEAAAAFVPETFLHPLAGPEGEALHAAACRVGPAEASNVILVISGTHGIEGYAGSAVQVGLLRDPGRWLRLPQDTAVVFLHMVNPWGAAWSRKENEDNAEQMRHFYYCHAERRPTPVFEDFYRTIAFERAKTVDEFFERSRAYAEVVGRHGAEEVARALREGQGTRPDSIVYSGGPPSWSKCVLDEVVLKHCRAARRIAICDLHTAVGGYGDMVVISWAVPGSVERQRVEGWFEGDLWPWDEEPISPYGFIAKLIDGSETVPLAIEAGTESLKPDDQYIFALDMWLHLHGDRMAPKNRQYVERYRRYFYPEEPVWMGLVWKNAQRRWEQLLAGVESWSREVAN